MPGDRGAAEASRYALLGLLLERPAHGYDLGRRFEPPSALSQIVHLTASHLYALLGRLERDGLIEGEQQSAGARPQRRVYRVAPAGRDAVMHWLQEPVGHPRDMRIEFPLKLYFALTVDSGLARQLVEQQRAAFEGYIADLRREPPPDRDDHDARYGELMRLARVGRARAAIDWLDACLPMVDEAHRG